MENTDSREGRLKIYVEGPEPHTKDLQAFLEVLNAESGRGVALVAIAMLDELVRRVIVAFLVESSRSSELIDGSLAPLGTFAAKCKLAFALGLITDGEYLELDRLRKIRNRFAHDVHVTFADQSVRDICARLVATNRLDEPRDRFVMSTFRMIVDLLDRPAEVTKRRLHFWLGAEHARL